MFTEFESVHRGYQTTKSLNHIYSNKYSHDSLEHSQNEDNIPLYPVEIQQVAQNESEDKSNQSIQATNEPVSDVDIVESSQPCTSKQAQMNDLAADDIENHNFSQEEEPSGHEEMIIFTSSQIDVESDSQQLNNIIKSNSEKTLSGFSEKTVIGVPSVIEKTGEENNKTLEVDSIEIEHSTDQLSVSKTNTQVNVH